MKKLFTIINAITLILMLIFDVCYMVKGGIILKAIASIMFVVTGIINFIYCIKRKISLKFPIWMLIGLVFAMLADIMIQINFYFGAILFAIGHIFYFISYCILQKINCRDLIPGIIVSAIIIPVILFAPFLNFGDTVMYIICCTYAIIISFMVGKAISNLLSQKSYMNIIVAIGSILFFISDFMLVLNLFGNISWASYMCLSIYYPAQFLLAVSLFIYVGINPVEEKKECRIIMTKEK